MISNYNLIYLATMTGNKISCFKIVTQKIKNVCVKVKLIWNLLWYYQFHSFILLGENQSKVKLNHYVTSVQIRSFFWSVFSCIQTEYRKIQTRKNFIFGHFSRSNVSESWLHQGHFHKDYSDVQSTVEEKQLARMNEDSWCCDKSVCF